MALITVALFVIGFVLLIGGAEFLVRGATRLATAAGVSSLVVGLTVVAYGTSAPELAVTVQSTYADPPQPDIAIGNIVGSNISNVLLVLGLAAAFAPLIVSRHIVRAGVPLMIGVSLLMYAMAWDGSINRIEGIVLFVGSLVYTTVTVVFSRREMRRKRVAESGEHAKRPQLQTKKILIDLGLVVLGVAMLTLGSRWLVNGAVQFAEWLGISKLIVGLTIVAVGTSLPEIATSVVAVLRGERDLAVGNVVGSNLFNILLVLGVCAMIAPNGVQVPFAALRFDIPVMVVVAVACLPVFFFDYRIARWEGLLFLLYYSAYITYLCLDARDHDALREFTHVMLMFVIPLTVLTFAVYWYRFFRRSQQAIS